MIAIALPLLCPPPALQDPFERFTLENGVRAAVWTAEGAESAAAFLLVPHGLLDDAPGRVQWAHLLEHALIRASHPDGLADGDLALNGETQGATLRLEVLSPPDQLDEALAVLADWLDNRAFEPAMLAREEGRIAQELENTCAGGHTGKWALAALGQVARHGARHVAVRGAVGSVEPAQLATYADERVRVGPALQVVVVGPVAVGPVRASLERTLGKLAAAEPAGPAPAVEPPAPGAVAATWDLPRRHYLEWYPLPGDAPGDRVAHQLLAQLVTQALFQAREPALKGGAALASIEEVLPGVRALVVSVGEVNAPIDAESLPRALREVLDAFAPRGKAWRSSLGMLPGLRAQLGQVPDLAALRRQLAGRPAARYLEANVALGVVGLERATGLTAAELAAAAQDVDGDRLRALGAALSAEARRALTLTPAR